MRLSPSGIALSGVSVRIAIDGVVPPALAAMSIGGSWGWLDTANDLIAGQGDLSGGTGPYALLQYVISTDSVSLLDATPTGVNDAAQQFRSGNNKWGAFLAGGPQKGVRSNIMARLPLAAIGDIDDTGRMVVVQNYASDNGLVSYTAGGSTLWTNSTNVLDGSNRVRSKDGSVAYEDLTSAWHLRNVVTGALQAFAPRTDAIVSAMVPVSLSGTIYVVELTDTQLTIRPATSPMGYVLATSANLFNPDAVSLTATSVRVGWSITTGEGPTQIRVADLNITTGGTTLGSTATGSLVFGSETPGLTAAFATGPVEGGDGFFASISLPQHQQVLRQSGLIDPVWLAALQQTADAATGLIDVSRLEGTIPVDLTVLDGANILPGTIPLDALVDETESTLIGRGEGLGDGPPEEITLGSGLHMTGTVLSASGSSWIPLVTGAEPPVFVTDGSGVLILVGGPV